MPVNAETFTKSNTATLFSEASLTTILEGLAQGRVHVKAVDLYFRAVAALPNNGQRTSWEKIPHISLHPPAGYSGTQALSGIGYAEQQKELVLSIGQYFGIANEHGIFFEDHYADCALELTYNDFAKLIPDFINMPGHKYFVAKNGRWLVNVTMEDDVYFTEKITLQMP